MRWLGFAIVAVVGLTLQTCVAWRFQAGAARPDWMLVLATFFALHVRSEEGLIAACILGAAADFQSIERFGLMTLMFGLSGLLLYGVRDFFFTDHPLTHFFLTFVPALLIGLASQLYAQLFVRASAQGWAFSTVEAMLTAAYTGLWAIPIHRLLRMFPRFLGVRPSRSRGPGGAIRPRHV